MDFWQVLPAAIALLFIIEGALPFISPNRWRNILTMAEKMDDSTLRGVGLGSMVLGLIILYWVH